VPEFQSCSQFGGESHTTANSGGKRGGAAKRQTFCIVTTYDDINKLTVTTEYPLGIEFCLSIFIAFVPLGSILCERFSHIATGMASGNDRQVVPYQEYDHSMEAAVKRSIQSDSRKDILFILLWKVHLPH
jgi:hypothetical protein